MPEFLRRSSTGIDGVSYGTNNDLQRLSGCCWISNPLGVEPMTPHRRQCLKAEDALVYVSGICSFDKY